MGFTGGERTTRRTVAEAKAQFRAGRRRVYRPWVTEPGLWLQYDFGDGPTIAGRKTTLWCAWLAWSRSGSSSRSGTRRCRRSPRVWTRRSADRRSAGLVLTDNEKTVTTDHVAGIAVRNPEIVEVARHYGMTIRPAAADPETKGGWRRPAGRSARRSTPARTGVQTRRKPAERLAEEQQRLHPLPKRPFTAAFGTTRRVYWDSTISVEAVRYSVPHELIDTRVWARFHGDELIVTAVGEDSSAREVARHRRGQARQPGPGRVPLSAPRGQAGRPHPQGHRRGGGRLPFPRPWRRFLAGRGWGGRCPPHQGEDGRSGRVVQALLGRGRRPGSGHRRGHRTVRGQGPAVHPRLPGHTRAHRARPPQRGPLAAARHLGLVRLRPAHHDLAPDHDESDLA